METKKCRKCGSVKKTSLFHKTVGYPLDVCLNCLRKIKAEQKANEKFWEIDPFCRPIKDVNND